MKLSVGHNDGYLMLLCLIDGGLQAFQGARPYSFASQPFDCFAEDIQFCVPFFFWEEI